MKPEKKIKWVPVVTLKDGESIELYVVEYFRYPLWVQSNRKQEGIKCRKRIIVKVPSGQAPAVKVYQLQDAGKIQKGWDRIREATPGEVLEWKEKHLGEVA